jgi:hypothetical protein
VPPRQTAGLFGRILQHLRRASGRDRKLVCQEVVELVTAYLDGALDPGTRARFEAHLEGCDGCATYLDQLRAIVGAFGSIRDQDLDPVYRMRLMDAFAETTGSW